MKFISLSITRLASCVLSVILRKHFFFQFNSTYTLDKVLTVREVDSFPYSEVERIWMVVYKIHRHIDQRSSHFQIASALVKPIFQFVLNCFVSAHICCFPVVLAAQIDCWDGKFDCYEKILQLRDIVSTSVYFELMFHDALRGDMMAD